MPSPDFAPEIKAIKMTALASMQAGRASKAKRIRRSVRRSWTYGGGKKTAAKLAVGVGFGAIFVGVSVATAGAATPALIAGLAIGAYAVGQMTDAGFAKLGGRKYRGGRATNEWVEKYTRPDTAEKAKALEERAHKTARRAFEHYRRSIEKARIAHNLAVDASKDEATCDDAAALVMGLMSVTRHLEKSRIYTYPALFLCDMVLEAYSGFMRSWTGAGGGESVNAKVDASIKKLMEGHQGACESEFCFFDSRGAFRGGQPAVTSLQPLWTSDEIDQKAQAISEARNRLDLSAVCAPPLSHRYATRALYQDAGNKYEHRSVGVKIKHSVTSAWARKTKSEQKSYVASQITGAALSAGSAGIGGGLWANNININAGWEFLIEGGFQVVGNLTNETIDRNVSTTDASQQTIDRQKHGSAVAAEAQDYLRKAAVHLWEAQKIVDALQTSDPADTCDTAIDRLREIYKIRHHLGKTQLYLGQAIDFVVLLTTHLAIKIEASNDIHGDAFREIDKIMSRDHGRCGKVCYGASPPRLLE